MKVLFLSAVLLFSTVGMGAANLDGFHKNFNLTRSEDGSLKAIKMKMFSSKFSLKPFINKVKNDIKEEVSRLKQNNFADDQELKEFTEFLRNEGSELSPMMTDEERLQNVALAEEAIHALPSIDVEDSFKKIDLSGVIEKFALDLKEALFKFDLATIAAIEDARYFYRRNVTYEVVTRALEFAKKRFDSVPLLNLASYVIVHVHDLIVEQRLFHQYMMMQYLENVPASELGMSEDEVNRVYSSLFEAQIAPINFKESKFASENWERYGVDKFFTLLRAANNKVRRSEMIYDKISTRYNFAFVEVVENGERVVKNTLINANTFSSKMSTAYNFDKPNKVKRTRTLLSLAQVGLGFLPIPTWIKSGVDSFLNSFYSQQKRVEGALVGYFDMTQDQEMSEAIYLQTNNPYIVH